MFSSLHNGGASVLLAVGMILLRRSTGQDCRFSNWLFRYCAGLPLSNLSMDSQISWISARTGLSSSAPYTRRRIGSISAVARLCAFACSRGRSPKSAHLVHYITALSSLPKTRSRHSVAAVGWCLCREDMDVVSRSHMRGHESCYVVRIDLVCIGLFIGRWP